MVTKPWCSYDSMMAALIKHGHYFHELTCDTVKEFLSVLMPHSGREIWEDRDDWVFRGQRDAEWNLVPSALRNEGKELLVGLRPSEQKGGRWEGAAELLQRSDELSAILRFTEHADNQGHPVDISYPIWAQVVAREVVRREFPEDGARQMAALAQHYGVPTRLLDWCESPAVAAYFSVSEALLWFKAHKVDYLNGPQGALAVWAVSRSIQRYGGGDAASVRIFSVPKYSNPNLTAQRGWFSIVDDPRELKEGSLTNLDGFAKELEAEACGRAPLLWKVTLPWSRSNLLLGALRKSGVSAATVFPGLEGAAKALLEEPDAKFNHAGDEDRATRPADD